MNDSEFRDRFLKTVENRENAFHVLVWINGDPVIGEGTYIGGFSEINAKGASVVIGRHCDIASFVAINTAIYLSDSGTYVWINILQILIVCASYELERQSLRQFIKVVRVAEAGEMNAKLKLRWAAMETVQAAEALKAKCSLVHT